ncbi:hypothetical protein Tco_0388908 [Tanacetum coccineum]
MVIQGSKGHRHPRCITDELALTVEIDFTWSLEFAASVEARISLIMFEFSSCLFADSAMNLVSDSSKVYLRSGYEEFPLLRWYNPSPAALSAIVSSDQYAVSSDLNTPYGSVECQYGYIKNHKKTVKSGQARTRESEEYKKEAKESKPKPGSQRPQSNPVNSSKPLQDKTSQ